MTDSKIFDYEGYARIDNNTGVIEIVKPDGEIQVLTAGIGGELSGISYKRIRIKAYVMSYDETTTARHIFGMGKIK